MEWKGSVSLWLMEDDATAHAYPNQVVMRVSTFYSLSLQELSQNNEIGRKPNKLIPMEWHLLLISSILLDLTLVPYI